MESSQRWDYPGLAPRPLRHQGWLPQPVLAVLWVLGGGGNGPNLPGLLRAGSSCSGLRFILLLGLCRGVHGGPPKPGAAAVTPRHLPGPVALPVPSSSKE